MKRKTTAIANEHNRSHNSPITGKTPATLKTHHLLCRNISIHVFELKGCLNVLAIKIYLTFIVTLPV